MKLRQFSILLSFVFVIILSAGCHDDSEAFGETDPEQNHNNINNNEGEAEINDPESITLRISANHYRDDEFEEFFRNPIEATYSYIKVEKVDLPFSIETIEE